MNQFIRYNQIDAVVTQAMVQGSSEATATRMVEFLNRKKEKCAYNLQNNKYYINSFFPSIPSKAWDRFMQGMDVVINQDQRVPIQADIVVTGKCHCNCWHCFRSNYEGDDMRLEKIKECIDALYKLGTATVGITGGEPMLRYDILDIIALIPEGMEGQLYTTGHRIDDAFAAKLVKTNLSRCIISLDHYEEGVANDLRHNPLAHQEALAAIAALTAANLYTAVTVCITDALIEPGELEKYFEFIAGLGIQEVRVVMQIPQGKLEGKEVGRLYGNAIRRVKRLKKDYSNNASFPIIVIFCEFESADYMGCSAGSNYIAVNNDGLITPCVAVPLSFGNVYEESLESIYERMETYFPKSDRMCYGIATGRVISREGVDTTITPLPLEVSMEIAEKCMISTKRAGIFEYCAGCNHAEAENL